MKNKSPQEQCRIVFLIAGLSDAVIGIFFLLVALRIIPIFTGIPSRIFFLVGGLVFTAGTLFAIFNFSPRE